MQAINRRNGQAIKVTERRSSVKKIEKIFPKIAMGISFLCVLFAISFIVFPVKYENTVAASQIDAINVSKTEKIEVVSPQSKSLIPLGRTTGIKLFSQGTMVIGFAADHAVKTPAEAAGLKIGDVVTEANGAAITSNEDFMKALSQATQPEIQLKILRGNQKLSLTVKGERDDSAGYKIGAWVRDSLAGIGTITYVDPENGAFGALGHGVCDEETGTLMPIGGGSIMRSAVVDVKKGQSGAPGELVGEYDLVNDQGILYSNTGSGIFGCLQDKKLYDQSQAVPVASKNEIKEGKAQIIANVENDKTEVYDIEILKLYSDDDGTGRNMMIRVTDEKLIQKTGGIVQGMSGSPILQNGKLIGAVTHVLVNDPTRGYGIFIENMLDTAQSISKK